ncbi:MAG: molybdate ABC transporter substrate-binding protein [Phycisphaerales bacterium]
MLVLAAASTVDAVEEAAGLFAAREGADVVVSAGPSSGLAGQILEGAPADVFVSASAEWAEVLRARGRAAEVVGLLGNRLVIVVLAGNPAGVASPADLLGERVRWVALAGERVPAGVYAREALAHAGVYGGLVERGRIVRGGDVRMALAYVESGEAQAGVVYATDVRAASGAGMGAGVEVVFEVPSDWHERIVYPVVLVGRGEDATDVRREARAFFEFLQSHEAARVFESHGFEVLTGAGARRDAERGEESNGDQLPEQSPERGG